MFYRYEIHVINELIIQSLFAQISFVCIFISVCWKTSHYQNFFTDRISFPTFFTCRSSDQYLQEFPTRVYLDFRHNHHLLSPESLRKRDVSDETVQKLTALYKAGHTPLTALEVIKQDLQANYGDQYIFVSSDRSKCPDKQFCYR